MLDSRHKKEMFIQQIILNLCSKIVLEEFEDIRMHKSKKNIGQKKKDKRTNNNLQNIHIKLKME
jgi:hypothetical protein